MPKWVPGCFLFLGCCWPPPQAPFLLYCSAHPVGEGRPPLSGLLNRALVFAQALLVLPLASLAKAGPGQPKGLILP